MGRSRFHHFWPAVGSAQADRLAEIYADYRVRCVYDQLMAILGRVTYGPVWNARPTTRKEVLDRPVARAMFAPIAEAAAYAAPDFVHRLATLPDEQLTRLEAMELLLAGLQECEAEMTVSPSPCTQGEGWGEGLGAMSLDHWKTHITFPRRDIILELIEKHVASRPPAVAACLLHGSLADGGVADGFSDADLLVFLRPMATIGGRDLLDAAAWLFDTNEYLLRYNPLMHHGPMLVGERGGECCRGTVAPAVLIERGVWLGGSVTPAYVSDDLERLAAIGAYEQLLEARLVNPCDIRSAFDALWWASTVIFLPVLLAQIETGRAVYKRDVYAPGAIGLPPALAGVMESMSDVRRRLGAWVAAKLAEEVRLADTGLNPGVILAQYKARLVLAPDDLAMIGITAQSIQRGQELFEYVSTEALARHAKRVAELAPHSDRLIAWPSAISERPAPRSVKAYDGARAEMVRRASQLPQVAGLYEYGSVGCPGLSDLDLLVLLRMGAGKSPPQLKLNALPPEIAEVLSHHPLFADEELADALGGVMALFRCRQLWAAAVTDRAVRLTEEFDADTAALAYSVANCIKYPRDMVWMVRQPTARWTTLLAYLNSFATARVCLERLGVPVPKGVERCAGLSQSIRGRFLANGYCRLSELCEAMELMLVGGAELAVALNGYWLARFPILRTVLPAMSRDETVAWTMESAHYSDRGYPLEAPAVAALRGVADNADGFGLPVADEFRQIQTALRTAGQCRRRYIESQRKSAREPSAFVVGHPVPQVPTAPAAALGSLSQLGSARFRALLAQLNCFAAEQGVPAIVDGAEAWAVAWLWLAGLGQIQWRGKTVVFWGGVCAALVAVMKTLGADVVYVAQASSLRFAHGLEAPATVDAVVCFGLSGPRASLAAELARILRPGGVAALAWDIPGDQGEAESALGEFEQAIWRHRAFGVNPLVQWNIQDLETWVCGPAFRAISRQNTRLKPVLQTLPPQTPRGVAAAVVRRASKR